MYRLEDVSSSPVYAELFLDFPLCVVFGGLKNDIELLPFEMLRILRKYPCSRLLLRDFHQDWFLTRSFEDEISSVIALFKPKKVFFLGTSAGGFSAIRAANILRPNKTIVFSPQINISKEFMVKIGDNRWGRQRGRAYGITSDLDCGHYDIDVDVHVSNHKRDLSHAYSSRYNIIKHDSKIHPVSKDLKNNGKLDEILKGLLI